MKMALTVYHSNEEHYATRYFPPSKPLIAETHEMDFTLECNSDNSSMVVLEQEAREKARKLGIPFVIGLDKR